MVTLLVFPGQGAQRVGMGHDLYEAFPSAQDTLSEIDEALATPLSRIMREGPEEELQRTDITQPAILAHSAAVLSVVRDHLGPIVGAAGHSLGEYSAYYASGSLSLTDAVRLVRRRGELMYEAGTLQPGSMSAVLGLASDAVGTACAAASTATEVVVPANLNSPEQTVISGDPRAVMRAGQLAKEAGAKRVVPLNVSGAFHSPLMTHARPGLEEALGAVTFRDPGFPVVANATATPITTSAEAITELVHQLTAPVRWVEVVTRLAAIAGSEFRILELGPGTVLAGLVKRILGPVSVRSLGTAQSVEEFLHDAV